MAPICASSSGRTLNLASPQFAIETWGARPWLVVRNCVNRDRIHFCGSIPGPKTLTKLNVEVNQELLGAENLIRHNSGYDVKLFEITESMFPPRRN